MILEILLSALYHYIREFLKVYLLEKDDISATYASGIHNKPHMH